MLFALNSVCGLCHRNSCDQPQPGSFLSPGSKREDPDPGNEVDLYPCFKLSVVKPK